MRPILYDNRRRLANIKFPRSEGFLFDQLVWFGICETREKRVMNHTYESCIEACLACAAACDYCASACLKEKDVNGMAKCAQLDMECAAICRTASQFMCLESEHANAVCQLCADICIACAEECNKHNTEHCRRCASICRSCAEECAVMAAA